MKNKKRNITRDFTLILKIIRENYKRDTHEGDFPGGAVDKTPRSQCSGSGFDPWSGN